MVNLVISFHSSDHWHHKKFKFSQLKGSGAQGNVKKIWN